MGIAHTPRSLNRNQFFLVLLRLWLLYSIVGCLSRMRGSGTKSHKSPNKVDEITFPFRCFPFRWKRFPFYTLSKSVMGSALILWHLTLYLWWCELLGYLSVCLSVYLWVHGTSSVWWLICLFATAAPLRMHCKLGDHVKHQQVYVLSPSVCVYLRGWWWLMVDRQTGS